MGSELERVDNPFGSLAQRAETAAAVAEQSRSVAEAIAAMQIARANPRDPIRAMDMILTDCSMPALAENAIYEYARGGTEISGPSIRLAETIARRWGNIEMGVKEIGRGDGYSEVMAYAVDLQTGTRDVKTFQVRHWRDTKRGGYAITDERDIYETIANSGARRKRACILSVIPQDVQEAAVRQCELTLKQKVEITPDFINSLVETFAKFGVDQEMIEKRIQRRIDTLTPGLAVNLRKIHNSLRDGMSQVSDWFEVAGSAKPAGEAKSRTESLAGELQARAKPAAETKEAPKKAAPAAKETEAEAETGEITNASVRKAIQTATAQEALTTIMMDVMKLPADAEREQTMKIWNARVLELRAPAQQAQAAPRREPSPGPRQKPRGKPDGTDEIKAGLMAKMAQAKDQDALNEVANEASLYKWDEVDQQEIENRYQQCSEDLSL